MPFDPISAGLAGGQLALGVYGAIQGRRAAKKARRKQKKLIGMQLREYDKLEEFYRRGYKGSLADVQKQKEIDIGKSLQHGLASGVGLTSYGDPNAQYESSIGRSQRLKLEDLLNERMAGVAQMRSNLLGGIDVAGPSAESLSSSYSAIGQGLGNLALAWQPKGNMETPIGQSSIPEPTVPVPSLLGSQYSDLYKRKIGKRSYVLEE